MERSDAFEAIRKASDCVHDNLAHPGAGTPCWLRFSHLARVARASKRAIPIIRMRRRWMREPKLAPTTVPTIPTGGRYKRK